MEGANDDIADTEAPPGVEEKKKGLFDIEDDRYLSQELKRHPPESEAKTSSLAGGASV